MRPSPRDPLQEERARLAELPLAPLRAHRSRARVTLLALAGVVLVSGVLAFWQAEADLRLHLQDLSGYSTGDGVLVGSEFRTVSWMRERLYGHPSRIFTIHAAVALLLLGLRLWVTRAPIAALTSSLALYATTMSADALGVPSVHVLPWLVHALVLGTLGAAILSEVPGPGRRSLALACVPLGAVTLANVLLRESELSPARLGMAFWTPVGGLVAYLAWTERRRLGPLFRLPTLSHGLRASGLTIVLMLAWAAVYSGVLESLGFDDLSSSPGESGWALVFTFVVVQALCPGFFEELGFRGYCQELLGRTMTPAQALVTQAALFSVAHASPVIFVSHFGLGLLLGWCRQTTGSLLPGMLAHAGYNMMVEALV